MTTPKADVADLPGAIERCQTWCDSQDAPLGYRSFGPAHPEILAEIATLNGREEVA